MLIVAEVTVEMAEELKASALAKDMSVAAEVGRRLERLAKVEAEIGAVWGRDSLISFQEGKAQARVTKSSESLYSGPPNPWDMF